ncbi:CRP-like cAMP-binding protein [Rhizobium soli]|uniref:CRP-like cAMP-binding protein n=1 Tax=Rhizobium soli TaxID=424798 RepID=A0A7X0JGU6_9HYPH|nr:Crp/Fnr family transcriptional regulator [Rhizobium soli]MBB6507015.1 CRP-like cAMP-binding protein [Rhizobium soli]
MRSPNTLLSLLSEDDYSHAERCMEELELPQGMLLSGPDEVDRYCYFPYSGIGSTVAISARGKRSEIGLFGREGMSPASAILGSDRNPYKVIMQVPGHGARIEVGQLVDLIWSRPEIRRVFFRWAHVSSVQVALTALTNATQTIEQRLARWILMCHDRTGSDEVNLTHEFLAIMLAVRRPSVTTSLHVLEGRQMIHSYRGTIVVRDRPALEKLAADCYGGGEVEYQRVMEMSASV